MRDGPLLSEAIDQLRAEGLTIGPDKLHRLSVFGIHSTRGGRQHYLDPRALTDLRYVLEIERRMGYARDRDGLCLELAYRAYPTVPWDRVHRGARDRAAAVFARIDRELHRANNWGGPGFHRRRIPQLARQLGKHFIPKVKITANPANALARDLVEHVAQMLLRVAYNDEPFTERDVVRLLTMLGVEENKALGFASQATSLLNGICPLIRTWPTNQFRVILNCDPSEAETRAAVHTMRVLTKIWSRMNEAGIPVTLPSVPDYPVLEADTPLLGRLDAETRCVLYVAAFEINAHEAGRQTVERFDGGETAIIDAVVNSLATMVAAIPKIIGVQNARTNTHDRGV